MTKVEFALEELEAAQAALHRANSSLWLDVVFCEVPAPSSVNPREVLEFRLQSAAKARDLVLVLADETQRSEDEAARLAVALLANCERFRRPPRVFSEDEINMLISAVCAKDPEIWNRIRREKKGVASQQDLEFGYKDMLAVRDIARTLPFFSPNDIERSHDMLLLNEFFLRAGAGSTD